MLPDQRLESQTQTPEHGLPEREEGPASAGLLSPRAFSKGSVHAVSLKTTWDLSAEGFRFLVHWRDPVPLLVAPHVTGKVPAIARLSLWICGLSSGPG